MRKVLILGSTGSIGTQALEVIAQHPDRFDVVGLSALSNTALLSHQAQQFGVPADHLAVGSIEAAALVDAVECDVVLNGITGSVGLLPTLRALENGRTLALANKESLIVGGALVTGALQRPDQIVPVDSEHSALAQAMMSGSHAEIAKLIVTASGGPFRGRSRDSLREVTPEQALAHPTWNMGQVVTTNSATLVNKGLEVIEAHLLFGIDFERIEVTVHPQSVIHSMVEFVDGSTLAQASPPDMKLPIAWGLSWPDRVAGITPGIDWSQSHTWSFEPLDEVAFPAVAMAKAVGAKAQTFPAVFNAANEQAVYAFHRGELPFLGITEVIDHVLNAHVPVELSLDALAETEAWARASADSEIARRRP